MSRARRVAAAASVVLAVVVAACQSEAPSGSAGPGTPASGSTDAGATLGPPPSPTLDTEAPIEIDATLLDYLPESVGDVAIEENLDEAAVAVSDPTLSRVATGVDVGFGLDVSSGDLVTAHVVRLREGAFDEAAFRDWRDTFDAGACAAAGGVKGRAETTIDDRNVFITTCITGLRTYHVLIPDQDLLVSAASIGDGNFGELLVNGLRVQ